MFARRLPLIGRVLPRGAPEGCPDLVRPGPLLPPSPPRARQTKGIQIGDVIRENCVKEWFFVKMVGCIEFRRSKTYKNDPLFLFFKNSKYQNNLMIWQPK